MVGLSNGATVYLSDTKYVWKYTTASGIVSPFVHVPNSGPGYAGDTGPVTNAKLNDPRGLWLSTTGGLYIADSNNNRILWVSPSSIIITIAGGGPNSIGDNGLAAEATLVLPYGVYQNSVGKLFIADTGHNRIRMVDTNSIITTFAGTGNQLPITADNIPATSSNINVPYDVKGDSVGNIYIAENANCAVRMVGITGILTTLFGSAGNCGGTLGLSSPSAVLNGILGLWVDTLSNNAFSTVYFSDGNTIHQSVVLTPTSQPSGQPSGHPSAQPVLRPTGRPTNQPSNRPTAQPSRQPITRPSAQPTARPTLQPFASPSSQPTRMPSVQSSCRPTSQPSRRPSSRPSQQPTSIPTGQPSLQPTTLPTTQPSRIPSSQPSNRPTAVPTERPSSLPSSQPTCVPSNQPSSLPSIEPISIPSNQPISRPSLLPTACPSNLPSACQPSFIPTIQPTNRPSSQPTAEPSNQPSVRPSCSPTLLPSSQPSSFPTVPPTSLPSSQPTCDPSALPTGFPSNRPSESPSGKPSGVPSNQPTSLPSSQPTNRPSTYPTVLPSVIPSSQPISFPSIRPSIVPSSRPTDSPTKHPISFPSTRPSSGPTNRPSLIPSNQPTAVPTMIPVSGPSSQPSSCPSSEPSVKPSCRPSRYVFPSSKPSNGNTVFPSPSMILNSESPSTLPSAQPTIIPSELPTLPPSSQPTIDQSLLSSPTSRPSVFPNNMPSQHTTVLPNLRPSTSPYFCPSCCPSDKPSVVPSVEPSAGQSSPPQPTLNPSLEPACSTAPSLLSTMKPTLFPSKKSILVPSTVFNSSGGFLLLPPLSIGFKSNLFLLGKTSLSSSEVGPDTSNIDLTRILSNQKTFIVFGSRNGKAFQKNIEIGSSESNGRYEEIITSHTNQIGLVRDRFTRSSTLVGDISNDGFEDLVIGYPLLSICLVFYGSVNGFPNNPISPSFAIYGATTGDDFGWSVSQAGDANEDFIADFIICAKAAGICYVLYGRKSFPSQFRVQQMSSTDGFRIIGTTSSTINFGLSVDSAGDFNKDGRNDLVISALLSNTQGQGIIYVIYGRPVEQLQEDITLTKIVNSSSLYTITSPMSSFAGLSVAGIGDVNEDGFADIAIGSSPFRGGYTTTQQTYVIYGRNAITMKTNTLTINEMETGKDGFRIEGAGFLVAGLGDVNEDGVDDLMITSYYDWQGQTDAYLISYPDHKNMNFTSPLTFLPSSLPSSSPSFIPSCSPTRTVTTEYPTNVPFRMNSPPILTVNESNKPTVFIPVNSKPTKRPTITPSMKKTHSPTVIPSQLPTTRNPTRKPSFAPSHRIVQTTGPSLRQTLSPSFPSTLSPQISTTNTLAPTRFINSNFTVYLNDSAFEVINCDKPGDFQGKDNRNEIFVLPSPGVYHISSRSSSTAGQQRMINNNIIMKFVKVFSISPVSNQLVFIELFDSDTDIINLSKFRGIRTLNDLSYSSNPVKFVLPLSDSSSSSGGSSSSSILSFSRLPQTNNETISASNSQTITLPQLSDLSALSEKNFRFGVASDSVAVDSSGSMESFSLAFSASNNPLIGLLVVFREFIRADLEAEKKENGKGNVQEWSGGRKRDRNSIVTTTKICATER
jgi:hypothetical protein